MAMLLARAGHRVLMVDRAPAGTDTISTHTLLRTAVLQLDRWGLLERIVDEGTPPIHRVTLGFGSRLYPIELSDDFGVDALYAPRRTLLDPILGAAAIDAGAEYLDRTTATELIMDSSGRVVGLGVESGTERSVVSARFVVGADGWRSRIARLAEAVTYRSEPGNSTTMYAYYRGVDTDGVHFQFTPGVNAGLIPTNDGLVCVYLALPNAAAARLGANPERSFESHVAASHPTVAEAIAGAERMHPYRRMAMPGFLRQPWGSGWALVGDAGFSKDPISAHGISDAFRDAELCARAIDLTLQGAAGEAEAMSEYHARRDQFAIPMLDDSAELAAHSWDEERASVLMRRISETVKEESRMLVDLPEWLPSSRPMRVGR
jgi:2-polyprenyl-6-methoxyphenol hydroxylase-like FAD-dependent oxidoreductase